MGVAYGMGIGLLQHAILKFLRLFRAEQVVLNQPGVLISLLAHTHRVNVCLPLASSILFWSTSERTPKGHCMYAAQLFVSHRALHFHPVCTSCMYRQTSIHPFTHLPSHHHHPTYPPIPTHDPHVTSPPLPPPQSDDSIPKSNPAQPPPPAKPATSPFTQGDKCERAQACPLSRAFSVSDTRLGWRGLRWWGGDFHFTYVHGLRVGRFACWAGGAGVMGWVWMRGKEVLGEGTVWVDGER